MNWQTVLLNTWVWELLRVYSQFACDDFSRFTLGSDRFVYTVPCRGWLAQARSTYPAKHKEGCNVSDRRLMGNPARWLDGCSGQVPVTLRYNQWVVTSTLLRFQTLLLFISLHLPLFSCFLFYLSLSISLSQSPLQLNKYTLNIIGEFSRTIVITLQRRIIETRGV